MTDEQRKIVAHLKELGLSAECRPTGAVATTITTGHRQWETMFTVTEPTKGVTTVQCTCTEGYPRSQWLAACKLACDWSAKEQSPYLSLTPEGAEMQLCARQTISILDAPSSP